MKTKLYRFKVSNFRSIEESDWIEISDNSCLIGTNEAGKTNLLLALWKLNPANDEPIVPLDDFPRNLYSNYKADKHEGDIFISADFILRDDFSEEIARELGCDQSQVKRVLVQRMYNGKYYISFPYSAIDEFPSDRILALIENFFQQLISDDVYIKEEEPIKTNILDAIEDARNILNAQFATKDDIESITSTINKLITEKFGKRVNLPDFFKKNLVEKLDFFLKAFNGDSINTTKEIRQKTLKEIPKFVYYSDYGNLDSEIYLQRVIEDFKRSDLSESARAKVRTLKVLFKFVNLSPEEIFELGNDRKIVIKTLDRYDNVVDTKEEELDEDEIQKWADKKRERGILLRAAASQLTQNFKKWWLQGDYIFEFEADGNHFRINVSDKLRPEAIELEGRSRGLQWFFSFFLVFLVETKEEHSNTILLLDEPGLSLHPIAQYDLAKFFRKLSEDNQLVYTSHSPFLVDMDNLANVKAVYIDKETGRTKVSSNLRYDDVASEKSIYPVHAALGLTVSDTLLLGCNPILVEGVSDQIYLNIIKRFLINSGKLKYSKELVFIPSGGVKGISPIAKLVSSREDNLPYVLLDSDKVGKEYKKQLINGKYRDQKEKILEIADFLREGEFEIEDLMPVGSITSIIDRMYRSDNYFEDYVDNSKPIVNQIQDWAKENAIVLNEGWKVEIAKTMQNRFPKVFDGVADTILASWENLFSKISN